MLKERAVAYRQDPPEVQEALKYSGIEDLAQPTLAEGETVADLLADRSSYETSTPTRPASATTASSACTSSPCSTSSASAPETAP